MNHDLKIVHSVPASLGESPYWDEESKQLYWLDIMAGEIHGLNVELM